MGFPPTPDASGDLESMDFLAGQSVGLVAEIKPAADVVRAFIEGAKEILSQLAASADN
jgi:nitronate monooxygenase